HVARRLNRPRWLPRSTVAKTVERTPLVDTVPPPEPARTPYVKPMAKRSEMLLDDDLIQQIQELPARLQPFREEILASLITIGQMPGDGGNERQRVRHLIDQF